MRTLVVAPHPDDEVLGAGGILLRRREEGAAISWVIMTEIREEFGWPREKVDARSDEIKKIAKFFGFDKVYELGFPATRLDQVPTATLVESLSKSLLDFQPNEVLIPHFSDIHSDHRITFEVASSAAKRFRIPTIRRVLSYETLSETDFNLIQASQFTPNVFVDITSYLDNKVNAMKIYTSEISPAPFPRSLEGMVALARFRGGSSGFKYAEAFQLLREFE